MEHILQKSFSVQVSSRKYRLLGVKVQLSCQQYKETFLVIRRKNGCIGPWIDPLCFIVVCCHFNHHSEEISNQN